MTCGTGRTSDEDLRDARVRATTQHQEPQRAGRLRTAQASRRQWELDGRGTEPREGADGVSNCKWVASDRPRVIRDRHEDECAGECEGCLPCDKDHCTVQWYGERGTCETHAASVCPSCVAKVREHLNEIVRLSGMPLLEQV